MNEVRIFESVEFGTVRTVEIDGEPFFCLTDVCRVLEIKNASDCKNRLNQKGIVITDTLTAGGVQRLTYISESNLYKAIFQSRKPEAERFSDWVTSEVLPTIRKTGGYNLPQTYAEALRALADKAEEAERLALENETMRPKAEFFDAVADCKDAIPMGEVAKVLDMGIGRNKLFKELRKLGILQKNNIPYQEYIDRGYFRVVEQRFDKPYGEIGVNIKTLVYQSGIDYIRKKVKP